MSSRRIILLSSFLFITACQTSPIDEGDQATCISQETYADCVRHVKIYADSTDECVETARFLNTVARQCVRRIHEVEKECREMEAQCFAD